MSDSGRHILAKEVDQLVRNFKHLSAYRRLSSAMFARFLQAKRDLDGMIEKLDVQIDEDQETATRLRLRLPRLQVAMTRATANNDLRSRHEMDREIIEISIRLNKIVAEIRRMVEDENKIFNLVIEL
ncbi:uncharacterized protein EAF02_003576 [Botrytis sinoallii]|uniref:uncharacterized protein n=1 Tax=Botrytis sinoallii TaxID=1463999 RepID=UPI0019011F90|nr:uncharacterized protein EAF02_003576 [Botrytis sinoallii]KAF7886929.1 hypothetical protein EAF02_003576 [Botrytis sinoallii]